MPRKLSAPVALPLTAMMALLLMLVLALSMPSPANAAPLDTLYKGPRVGTAVADKVMASDQSGQLKDFGALKRQRGLILMFSRSFDW